MLAAIQSFNDPSIITNIFRDLGWNYSVEIKETLALARQNANLSIKFKALKHLRELLREAAETSGYVANVSQTVPNAQGGVTSFHAKRIANVLNPTKQIESKIKESENDKKETRTDLDRESGGGQSQTENTEESVDEQSRPGDSSEPIRDSRCAFPIGDVDSGGTESQDGGEAPRTVAGDSKSDRARLKDKGENPCIKTKPPTCDRDLFPGISAGE